MRELVRGSVFGTGGAGEIVKDRRPDESEETAKVRTESAERERRKVADGKIEDRGDG